MSETTTTRLVGNTAPAWSADALVNGEFKTLSSADYKGKWKVLYFYPLDFTFVCPTEMHALQAKLDEFRKRDVEVMGISIDSVYSHLSWLATPKNKGGIAGVSYTLISDITKNIAREYGVLNEDAGVALRGVFLIDKNNVIQYASIHNLSLGRNVHEILRVIDALAHVEENGTVCPANWVPGEKSMKPTTDGLAEYFG